MTFYFHFNFVMCFLQTQHLAELLKSSLSFLLITTGLLNSVLITLEQYLH